MDLTSYAAFVDEGRVIRRKGRLGSVSMHTFAAGGAARRLKEATLICSSLKRNIASSVRPASHAQRIW